MKIVESLSTETIMANLKANDKSGAITELVELLKNAGKINSPKEIIEALLNREQLGSTGIGQGVAIPHCKTDLVNEQILALGLSHTGVNFQSLDGEPVYIIFMLISSAKPDNGHLQAMAKISRVLKNKTFRKELLAAKSAQEIMELITKEENI